MEKAKLLALLKEKKRRDELNARRNFAATMFPETGPLSRHHYPRHMEFFAAGAQHDERLFMAGNRVGKTIAGGYEARCHLTGRYPEWWIGKRFDKPVTLLAAGDTGQTTRDIIQQKLLGGLWESEEWGTGLIEHDCLPRKPVFAPGGTPGLYDTIYVKHVSGKFSQFKLRTYAQGRKIFQGFELDVFWADEEIPVDVYYEGIMRLMTTRGIAYLTFTPLSGVTQLVKEFLEARKDQVQLPGFDQ